MIYLYAFKSKGWLFMFGFILTLRRLWIQLNYFCSVKHSDIIGNFYFVHILTAVKLLFLWML